MVVCRSSSDISREFGFPVSAPEKYFIDAGMRVVDNGATALMTRLPYDNEQSHMFKYIDYKLEEPISMADIATVARESITRERDNAAVDVLKEMHNLDSNMNQLQRLVPISDDVGVHINSMYNDLMIDIELDPEANLEENTLRIIDIRGEQYGTGAGGLEYTGIFTVFVPAPMALYCQ